MHCISFVYRVYECVYNPNSADISVMCCRRLIKSRDIFGRCSYRRRGIYFMAMTVDNAQLQKSLILPHPDHDNIIIVMRFVKTSCRHFVYTISIFVALKYRRLPVSFVHISSPYDMIKVYTTRHNKTEHPSTTDVQVYVFILIVPKCYIEKSIFLIIFFLVKLVI